MPSLAAAVGATFGTSLKVKVILAVSPSLSAASSVAIATVGAILSKTNEICGGSEAEGFPAASAIETESTFEP